MHKNPNHIEKLGDCYLDEIYAADPFIYTSKQDHSPLLIYKWAEISGSDIAALFPNFDTLNNQEASKLISSTARLTTAFYNKQKDYKIRLSGKRFSSGAVLTRKECTNLLKYYIRNSPERILDMREKVADVLGKKSKMTLNFLGFLATTSKMDVYVKPKVILSGKASDQQLLKFEDVLRAAIQVCNVSIKKGGGHKPIYTQMVTAFGELYFQTTNRPPARKTEHHDTNGSEEAIENHPLIHIVRAVAQAIEDQLPKELKDNKPPDLAKACRHAARQHYEHIDNLTRE